jgi:hypothetical protein
MIISKRKGRFVAKQNGIPVCAVIAPTRMKVKIITDYLGANHGNYTKQGSAK